MPASGELVRVHKSNSGMWAVESRETILPQRDLLARLAIADVRFDVDLDARRAFLAGRGEPSHAYAEGRWVSDRKPPNGVRAIFYNPDHDLYFRLTSGEQVIGAAAVYFDQNSVLASEPDLAD